MLEANNSKPIEKELIDFMSILDLNENYFLDYAKKKLKENQNSASKIARE